MAGTFVVFTEKVEHCPEKRSLIVKSEKDDACGDKRIYHYHEDI